MKAKDLMTKDVLAIDKDERLQAALDMMVKHRVSKLVVLDKKHLVGIVTNGDIADELGARKNAGVATGSLRVSTAMRRHFATTAPEADLEATLRALLEQDAGIVPVVHDQVPVGVITATDALTLVTNHAPLGAKVLADVMTATVHAVAPSDRVIHARRMMLDHHVERLPVLDHGKLVGILGATDIATGLARFKDTIADHHQAHALQRFLVNEIMVQTVVSATPETTVRDAIETMRKKDVGALPVLRNERIVGLVTRTDLLKLAPR